MIALYHDAGIGVAQNKKEAFNWFYAAAEQGDASAQYNLALRYLRGVGTQANEKEAVEWFRLASLQGVPEAQNNLAVCYAEGIGVAQNKEEALFWFHTALAGGVESAREPIRILEKELGDKLSVLARERCNQVVAEVRQKREDETPPLITEEDLPRR
ncbi:tetratricopeptide repeat protein [Kamptonema cortianum]|nr:tetratricopeptide repeat protein [Oscillatoria laete-virens]MDK3157151.1 tetratricopeptide repeat protein [Kamptonema cortianum]MDL5055034.1 tetratricopeptide repeat protein [Oscillatoria laete-virens NRMC-F 0139]